MSCSPIVLLGVCTPAELADWPIDAWVLLDCTGAERRRRLAKLASTGRLRDVIHDAGAIRSLRLPAIDSTGRTPEETAAGVAGLVRRQEQR